jgi:hypothetical protein
LKVDEKNAQSLKEIAEMMREFNASRKWSEVEAVTVDQPEVQNRAIRTSRTMKSIMELECLYGSEIQGDDVVEHSAGRNLISD